ncbi:MAG TPA: hypothetical protein DIT13_04170 [Verrucomicrobiales bacterium]|nr:hypothetical protein [Verrucomicrobiales bacterium]
MISIWSADALVRFHLFVMNSVPQTRRKWELGIAGLLILVTAVCSGWMCGIFGNVPPYPQEFHDQEVRRRIETANKLQEQSIPRGEVHYPWYNWEPQQLDTLRDRLSWESGKISIQPVAYMNGVEPPKPGQISVFLINDTDEQLQVPAQDGDIYLKLEVNLEGKWQRAQCHGDSWCGNSYGTRTLAAHSYVIIQGYQPTPGRRAKVRYAIHNGASDRLTSAKFDGLYAPDDVAMSAYDSLAMREAELSKLRKVLLRQDTPTLMPGSYTIDMMRRSAWYGILRGGHDRDAALKIAEEVLAYDPTLEPRKADLGQLMDSWHAALEHETRGRVMIHGFTVSKRLVQNTSHQAHQNNGTP